MSLLEEILQRNIAEKVDELAASLNQPKEKVKPDLTSLDGAIKAVLKSEIEQIKEKIAATAAELTEDMTEKASTLKTDVE